ncbi:MAG: hypothetical protein NKF70_10685 [Methanobacterium sp. ERen5]|nr:MAG: hypothetical protein NKF70_10685 [Methanobacterium sp. ERen5]
MIIHETGHQRRVAFQISTCQNIHSPNFLFKLQFLLLLAFLLINPCTHMRSFLKDRVHIPYRMQGPVLTCAWVKNII